MVRPNLEYRTQAWTADQVASKVLEGNKGTLANAVDGKVLREGIVCDVCVIG